MTENNETKSFNENTGVLEYLGKQIKTLPDLLSECKVDLGKWKVKSWKPNSWNTSFKVKVEGEEQIKIVTNYQVTANLERRPEKPLKDIYSGILSEIKKHSPKVSKIHNNSKNNNLLLEIALADIHLGRLSWKPSDGSDYDLKIARKLVFDSVYDLMAKSSKFGDYKQIVLWISGDFFNCDNQEGTTTKGTPQTNDSRFPKVFKEGKDILVELVNCIKQVAPVEIVFSYGNHDNNSLFHLGEVISAWFHNDQNVKVNNDPTPRKYRKFGNNLICWTHGDKALKKLPEIASGETPHWSSCKYREWHVGHLHHEKVETIETGAIKTRVMPTIAGIDKYHCENGYVNNIRCLQAFVWDEKDGLQSILYSKSIES